MPLYNGFRAPTVQTFTSGSGTYTTPENVRWIRVRMVGGGGGGAGSGTGGTGGAGTAGGNTTFGTSLLTANGGNGASSGSDGAAGGTVTVSAPAITSVAFQGGSGFTVSQYNSNSLSNMAGASGGVSFFGGAGRGVAAGAGVAPVANTGSGGAGGGGGVAGVVSGGGGGAGGYIDALIYTPSTTYSYAIGAAGAGGAVGTSGTTGSAGAAGIIIVEEYYQ